MHWGSFNIIFYNVEIIELHAFWFNNVQQGGDIVLSILLAGSADLEIIFSCTLASICVVFAIAY